MGEHESHDLQHLMYAERRRSLLICLQAMDADGKDGTVKHVLGAMNPHAPWFVIPANHKWFRNLAVSQIIVETLQDLGMRFPEPTVDMAKIRRK